MPLSEEEQRILSEIESQLRASDPDLARQVGSTTIYSHALRQLRWGIVAFVASFAGTVLLLTVSFLLAFVGFLGMVASALVIVRAARRMGRAGIGDAGQAIRGGGFRGYVNGAGKKARERFKRPEDDAEA
ncbi:DUF3040 domain-containing protein [Dermatobacter hominis]|uniref:DUF3040 domain-containing protein n=1 Tax=Dermatobacter hominis TaxID=2884263 RepID=UPI001D124E95|nr:DUF3040 domain-containing protein [Dermatobacter hominis]UDY35960.1 DUF3040 domain-containing protein [Dermatobacter hominis]